MDRVADVGLVVDDQEAVFRGGAHAYRLLATVGWDRAGHDGFRGRRTRKTVPPPGRGSTSIRPPCPVTIPWLIDSPRPVPSPTGLVVKKGSNRWGRCSGSIPAPLSATSRTPKSPSCRVDDPDQSPLVLALGLDRLHGVDQEVEDHLADLRRDAEDARGVAVVDLDGDALATEAALDHLEPGGDQVGHRGRLELGGGGPRQAPEVLDDVGDALHAVAGPGEDALEVLADVGPVDLLAQLLDRPEHVGRGGGQGPVRRLVVLPSSPGPP